VPRLAELAQRFDINLSQEAVALAVAELHEPTLEHLAELRERGVLEAARHGVGQILLDGVLDRDGFAALLRVHLAGRLPGAHGV
jgi:hypothetical protein